MNKQKVGVVWSHSIKSLLPGTWVNDEPVNFVGGLLNLMCRDDCLHPGTKQQSYFIFPTTFITQLLNKSGHFSDGEYTYARVIQYTHTARKDINIFTFDKVFVPINFQNLHWYFAMINMREKTIQIYNSSDVGELQANRDLHHLLHYLRDEHKRIKDPAAPPLLDQWKLIKNQRRITPSQKNSMF